MTFLPCLLRCWSFCNRTCLVVHHHAFDCHVKKLDCCIQGQGCSFCCNAEMPSLWRESKITCSTQDFLFLFCRHILTVKLLVWMLDLNNAVFCGLSLLCNWSRWIYHAELTNFLYVFNRMLFRCMTAFQHTSTARQTARLATWGPSVASTLGGSSLCMPTQEPSLSFLRLTSWVSVVLLWPARQ